jgi:hypothetical protein
MVFVIRVGDCLNEFGVVAGAADVLGRSTALVRDADGMDSLWIGSQHPFESQPMLPVVAEIVSIGDRVTS